MLRVLTYHRVAANGDASGLHPAIVSATPDAFREQMLHLRRRYTPVDLERVVQAFTGGRTLPDRAVLVTFDDAYRDFGEVAWPIMKKAGIPATLFVPTAYPDSCRSFWWDRLYRAVSSADGNGWPLAIAPDLRLSGERGLRRAAALLKTLPHDEVELLVDRICTSRLGESATRRRSVLGWEELAELGREGVTFGAHTHHHVSLPHVPARRRHWEIRRSLDELARELGAGYAVLAYPYGIFDDEVVEATREEGCVLAFTTDDGLNRPGRTDPLRLRRTNITPRTTPALFPLRMAPWFAAVDRWRHRRSRAQLGA